LYQIIIILDIGDAKRGLLIIVGGQLRQAQ